MRAYLSTKIAFIAAIPIVLTACSGTDNRTDLSQLPNGFSCPVIPTGLSPPGTVYRETPEGTVFTVYVPNPAPPLRSSSFGNITSSGQKEVKASLVAKLIKLPVSANASADTKYTVTQNYTGTVFLDTTDSDVQPIIDKAKQLSPPMANDKYYIVREVMSATGIEYAFNKDISDSFGATIPVKVVQVNPNASYTNTGKFSYNVTFTPPAYACSKSETIIM
jgi:hypothetical protein